jgi:hypothetical protein
MAPNGRAEYLRAITVALYLCGTIGPWTLLWNKIEKPTPSAEVRFLALRARLQGSS